MNTIIQIFGGVLGSLISISLIVFVVITIIKRTYPGADEYFSALKPVIAEIDDRLDSILLEIDNKTLKRVSDIIGEIREGLKRAGYKLDDNMANKIDERVRAKIKQEGSSDSPFYVEKKDGQTVIGYKKNSKEKEAVKRLTDKELDERFDDDDI